MGIPMISQSPFLELVKSEAVHLGAVDADNQSEGDAHAAKILQTLASAAREKRTEVIVFSWWESDKNRSWFRRKCGWPPAVYSDEKVYWTIELLLNNRYRFDIVARPWCNDQVEWSLRVILTPPSYEFC